MPSRSRCSTRCPAPEGRPEYDPADDLRLLESLWLDRLQPYGDRGYMSPRRER